MTREARSPWRTRSLGPMLMSTSNLGHRQAVMGPEPGVQGADEIGMQFEHGAPHPNRLGFH